MTIRLLFILSIIYVLIFFLSLKLPPQSKLDITFFDIGQGDSIYIGLPTGERILIDGGASADIDYRINKKFMFPNCYFDYIFITHAHADHLGGLKRVTQHCNFKQLTFNDIGCDSKSCKYFLPISNKKSGFKGDIISINGVTLKVLWPDMESNNIDYSNINNTSIIVFLDYGDYEALFTGDAEKEVLDQLDISQILPDIQNGLDIYKVPHHGAENASSERLLQQLKPNNCIVSVGKNNKYGHPHKATLDTLNKVGCNILRTDELGDIQFMW